MGQASSGLHDERIAVADQKTVDFTTFLELNDIASVAVGLILAGL